MNESTINTACSSFNVGTTSKLLIPFTTSSRQQAPLTIEIEGGGTNNLICMITLIKTLPLNENITIKAKQLNNTHIQCILDDLFQSNEFSPKVV